MKMFCQHCTGVGRGKMCIRWFFSNPCDQGCRLTVREEWTQIPFPRNASFSITWLTWLFWKSNKKLILIHFWLQALTTNLNINNQASKQTNKQTEKRKTSRCHLNEDSASNNFDKKQQRTCSQSQAIKIFIGSLIDNVFPVFLLFEDTVSILCR